MKWDVTAAAREEAEGILVGLPQLALGDPEFAAIQLARAFVAGATWGYRLSANDMQRKIADALQGVSVSGEVRS